MAIPPLVQNISIRRDQAVSSLEKKIGPQGMKVAKVALAAISIVAVASMIASPSALNMGASAASLTLAGSLIKASKEKKEVIDLVDDEPNLVIEIDDDETEPSTINSAGDCVVVPNTHPIIKDKDLLSFLRDEILPKVHAGKLASGALTQMLKGSEYKRILSVPGTDDNSWLSDEGINTYIRVLQEKLENNPKVAFAESFFIPLLIAKKDSPRALERICNKVLSAYKYSKPSEDGECTKTPTQANYDALEQIFIPLNKGGNHWLFFRVDFKEKQIHVFDSIRANKRSYKGYTEPVVRYLNWVIEKHMSHREFPNRDWKINVDQSYPQQVDGYDCGFFTVRGMHKQALDPTVKLVQSQLREDTLRVLAERQKEDLIP